MGGVKQEHCSIAEMGYGQELNTKQETAATAASATTIAAAMTVAVSKCTPKVWQKDGTGHPPGKVADIHCS